MDNVYIQFEDPSTFPNERRNTLVNVIQKIILRLVALIIPKANPDFEDTIDKVKFWLVECNATTGVPEREIGLDDHGKVIMKTPDDDNFGYWTDSNMVLETFKEHFSVTEINKSIFEAQWQIEL
jgi:hypothetical protein